MSNDKWDERICGDDLSSMSRQELVDWSRRRIERSREVPTPDLTLLLMAEITAGRIESFISNNQPVDKWTYEQLLLARKKCREAGNKPSPFLESYIADVTTGQLLTPRAKAGRKREFYRDLQICDCIFQIVAKRSDILTTRNTQRSEKDQRKPEPNSVCDIVAEATGMIGYEAVRKVWKNRSQRYRG